MQGGKRYGKTVCMITAESDIRGSSASLCAHAVLVWLRAGGSSTAQCSGVQERERKPLCCPHENRQLVKILL